MLCSGGGAIEATYGATCGDEIEIPIPVPTCCTLRIVHSGAGFISRSGTNMITYYAPDLDIDDKCCVDPDVALIKVYACVNDLIFSATINISCNEDTPSILYATKCLPKATSITLGISNAGTHCNYGWTLTGEGSISVALDGLSVIYTAPDEISGCTTSATIKLLECGDEVDSVNMIIYNIGVAPTTPATVYVTPYECNPGIDPWSTFSSCSTWLDVYNCDGDFLYSCRAQKYGPPQDVDCPVCYAESGTIMSGPCNPLYGAFGLGWHDVRTQQMIDDGCCFLPEECE